MIILSFNSLLYRSNDIKKHCHFLYIYNTHDLRTRYHVAKHFEANITHDDNLIACTTMIHHIFILIVLFRLVAFLNKIDIQKDWIYIYVSVRK